jgi:hypothetical protein
MKNICNSNLPINKYAGLLLIACALLGLSGCVDFTMRSSWKDHEIAFDGANNEWQKDMVKEHNVGFGAFNDDQNLYLCLSVTDKVTKAQMMGLFRQDFYVWIDTRTGTYGKRMRNLGLRFSNDSEFMDEDMVTKTRYLKVHAFQVIADEMMNHLNIQVVRNFSPLRPLSEAKGIDSGVTVFKDGRQLVYVLKVPLVRSAEHPYAIGALPGATVYMGLETSPINVMKLEKQLRLDEYSDMKNAAPEESGGIGRGMGRPLNAAQLRDFEAELALENFRPIKIWCKIILAKKT